MRRLEEQILTEKYRRTEGKLTFSVRLAELSVAPGEAAEGAFTIFASQEEIPAQGYVLTKDERMECKTEWFNGVQEKIVYRFCADGLQEGDSLQGQFLIISDYGEYTLPWKVTVRREAAAGIAGKVSTLAGFTELARTDWKTAVQFFYSKPFAEICKKEGEKTWLLYRGLSAGYYNSSNVETFLEENGCKQALTFTAAKPEIQVKDVQETVREELQILKNGWGPVSLKVQTEDDFLFLEKNRIGEDDFLGNLCRLSVYISEEKLHDGKNFGTVTVSWSWGSFLVGVTATRRKTGLSAETEKKSRQKKYTIRLTELYLKLRAKQIDLADWQEKVRECVEELAVLDRKSIVPKLFSAQLLLTENKTEEAGWMLKQLRPMLEGESPAVVSYYLYLTTLYDKREEYVKRAAARVEEIYTRYPEEWRIAWLMLFLSREINRSTYRKWQFLQEQFQKGCVSPLLYQEAVLLLNADPALLTGLDPIVRRVLVYGARKGLLNENLCGQAAELACREKYFEPVLFEILERSWEKKQSPAILQAICSLLIKGNKCEQKWHVWYERGVENKLRVTRLYEYYLLSTDLSRDIEPPKSVLLYFAYQCNLDWEYAAWLYSCVERCKTKDPELYITYKPEMDHFLLDCLNKGRINRHLSWLYRENLPALALDKTQGETITSLLGSTEVVLNRKECRKLIIVHRRLKGEETYWLQDGKACVSVYDPEDLLFTEDEEQNRCLVTVDRKELLSFQDVVSAWGMEALREWGTESIAFLLEAEKRKLSELDQIAVWTKLCTNRQLEDVYGQELRCRLAVWLSEQEKNKELNAFLRTLSKEQIAEKDRLCMARLMILHGFYDKAYEWLAGQCFCKLEPAELMRLCSRLLAKESHLEEKRLMLLCAQAALNGKYDDRILQYLADAYEGSCSELEVLLQAAKNFEIDIWKINRKLLVQLLFTGQDVTERMDLLRDYISAGGSPELEEAFLYRCAYANVILKQPIHRYMVQMILRLCRWGAKVSRLCKIAALQYYAKNKGMLEEKNRGQVAKIIRELFEENCLLPVLQQFADLVPEVWEILDKTFVVYEGEPEKQLVLNYRRVEGELAEAQYHEMELPCVCDGIYAAGFILFPGERLQYYITVSERPEKILENGMLLAQEEAAEAMQGRYAWLYEMAQAQLLQEDLSAQKERTQNYLYTAFCAKRLFGMLK